MNFVNIHGDPVALNYQPIKRKTKDQPESYHNGWKVQGIPPGALEAARAQHAADVRYAQATGAKMPKEWDEGNWLMNAKRRPVRGKPYELEQAARQCAELAEKAGWLRVELVEMKKEAQPA